MPYHLAMSPNFSAVTLTTRDSLPDRPRFVNPLFEKSLPGEKQLWQREKSGILYPRRTKEDAKMEPKKPPLSPMDLGGMRRTFSSKKFEAQYTDLTRPLGALYTPEQTLFRVWAPTAIPGDPAALSHRGPLRRTGRAPEDGAGGQRVLLPHPARQSGGGVLRL